MQKYAFLILFLFICLFARTQAKMDSLWTVWNSHDAPDSLRINALHDIISNGYMYSRPDSAYILAQFMYEFASEIGLKKEVARALSLKGGAFLVRGKYQDALDQYHKSLTIFEEINNAEGMARTLNNIGVIYSNLGDFPKALVYHQRSLLMKEGVSDTIGVANSMNNIGLIYMNLGNYPRAIDYFQRSLKIREEHADKRGIAQTSNNIGLIFMRQNDYQNALDFFRRSFLICEELSDKKGSAGILTNIGIIYSRQKEYSKALDNFLQSLEIQKEMSDRKGIAGTLVNIGEIYMNQGNFTMAMDYYQDSRDIYDEIADKAGLARVLINTGNVYSKQGRYAAAISSCKQGLIRADEINVLDMQVDACQCLYDAYKALGDDKQALTFHERITLLNDSLNAAETSKKLQQMEFERQVLADSLIHEEERLRVQMAHRAEVSRKNRVRNIFIISAGFLLLLVGGLYWRMAFIRKAKQAIEREKNRSEGLLLNILPAEIADELKEKGRAEARKYERVTILFTDFKEFTRISEKLSPEELVGMINTCFKTFDDICRKYGIEKIKTIGDSYMAAGGLPVPSDDSVRNTVLAALEMNACMIDKKNNQENLTGAPVEMRVGLHTGPVIAGIVGVTKFQYDVWGDTVNTASRVESAGQVGKVTISQSTYEYIKDDPAFTFQGRGKINAKGKGDIEMWFVERA